MVATMATARLYNRYANNPGSRNISGRDEARIELPRAREGSPRGVWLAQPLQRPSELVMGRGVCFEDRCCAPEAVDGGSEIAAVELLRAYGCPYPGFLNQRRLRAKPLRLAEVFSRAALIPAEFEYLPECVMWGRELGLERNRPAQRIRRAGPVPLRFQHCAERVVRLDITRLRGNGRLQRARGAIEIPLVPINDAELVLRFRARLHRDAAPQLVGRFGLPVSAVENEGEVVTGEHVARRELQRTTETADRFGVVLLRLRQPQREVRLGIVRRGVHQGARALDRFGSFARFDEREDE